MGLVMSHQDRIEDSIAIEVADYREGRLFRREGIVRQDGREIIGLRPDLKVRIVFLDSVLQRRGKRYDMLPGPRREFYPRLGIRGFLLGPGRLLDPSYAGRESAVFSRRNERKACRKGNGRRQ